MLENNKINLIGKVFIYLTFFIVAFVISKNQLQKVNSLTADDLVLRINGAALQKDGKDIYTHKWVAGESEKYFYYSQRPTQTINGITATPFLLYTHKALIHLNYCDIKLIWLAIELFFLFAAGFLLINSFNNFLNQLIALIAFVVFFTLSPQWMVHIESGQVYIVYAFVFSLFYWLEKNNSPHKKWLQAILISTAILLRPIFIITALYFLVKKDVEMLKKGVTSFLVIGLFSLLLTPAKEWKEYTIALKEYSKEVVDKMTVTTPIVESAISNKTIDCINKPTLRIYTAGALYTMQKYLYNIGIVITNSTFYIALCLVLIILIVLPIKSRLNSLTIEQFFVLFFLFYIIFELTTPTVRNPYNIVQWLATSLIVICSWKINITSSVLMLIGLMLTEDVLIVFKYSREIGESCMIISSILFVWNYGLPNKLNKLNTSKTELPNALRGF